MTQQLNYIIFDSVMGWVGISGSAQGLLQVILPQCSVQEVRKLLGASIDYAIWSPHTFQDLMERLRLYFSGQRTAFPDELDLYRATAFQGEVWEITRLIPYGETRSYAWVAEQIRKPKAMRAVGQALARNPLPIIVPCHRVVAGNGTLGGYSGGVEMKKHFLCLEASANVR